jgi:hypothetical protein
LAGFVQSLRATWRPVLFRFVAAFGLLALLWLAVAPTYASLLAVLARPLIPLVEATRETPATRSRAPRSSPSGRFRSLSRGEVVTIRRNLWDGAGDYNVALLAALLLATPGWSWRQRGRALAWGIGLLALTQLAFFLVNVTYTQLWPITTKYGPLRPPGFSRGKLVLFDWLYAFFEFMGRGFFALLLYLGLVTFTWGRPDAPTPARSVGRNAPCPCGSGLKAKRCCGS